MDFITVFKYVMAVLELLFLVMSIVYFIKGLKSKNYKSAWKYVGCYLVLNLARHLLTWLHIF